jgi:hypothetical protein
MRIVHEKVTRGRGRHVSSCMHTPSDCLPLIPVNIADASHPTGRAGPLALLVLAVCFLGLALALGLTEAGEAIGEILGRTQR